jgi:hypothetical protein
MAKPSRTPRRPILASLSRGDPMNWLNVSGKVAASIAETLAAWWSLKITRAPSGVTATP